MLSDQDLDDYIEKRHSDPIYARNGKILRHGVKNSTISRELTDLKAILNWAAARRPPLIAFNPVANFKKPKSDDAIILPPSRDEMRKIIEAASPHLKRAILLSYYTGLRPGAVELLRLAWEDVFWESRVLLVISAQKGGIEKRLVPIHDEFMDVLKGWHREDEKKKYSFIIHYHGRAIKKIQKSWEGALIRAKIKRRIRPYDLRHYFITKALEEGADIKALAEIVGSRPETLMRHYQHVTKELHRQTVKKIPPLNLQKDQKWLV